jgi:hypothetical protein
MPAAGGREMIGKIMSGCGVRRAGTGNLPPRVDDCKPLWMPCASSGRSLISRNPAILGTAAPTVAV